MVRALLIGKPPGAELGYEYVSEEPYDAVVVGSLSLGQLGSLAYLTVGCTTLALLFQNMGQAHIPPASASLLLSLESPFGVFFSVLFGAELLSAKMVFGFVLVFAAIIVSEYLPEKLAARSKAPDSALSSANIQ